MVLHGDIQEAEAPLGAVHRANLLEDVFQAGTAAQTNWELTEADCRGRSWIAGLPSRRRSCYLHVG